MLNTRHSGVSDQSDYDPFGMLLVGRIYGSEEYRYGFNGQENTDEIYGDDNSLDFGARIYDPRLGRWLSVDPVYSDYPGHSPYCFAANSPLMIIDVAGEKLFLAPAYRDKALDIVRSWVPEEYRAAIQVRDDGEVYIDASKIPNDIHVWDGTPPGTDYVFYLLAANEKMLFELTDGEYTVTDRKNENKQITLDIKDNKLGIVNLSFTPYYFTNPESETYEDQPYIDNFDEYLPKEGFDGHVIMDVNAVYTEGSGYLKGFETVAFHEVAENYYRTVIKLPYHYVYFESELPPGITRKPDGPGGTYFVCCLGKELFESQIKKDQGAHDMAIEQEKKWEGRSDDPGRASRHK